MAKKETKEKKERKKFSKPFSRFLIILFWILGLTPLWFILFLRYVQTDSESLPSVSTLENQEELLATTIFADDGVSELGKYWAINRTSVPYNEISPYVISALISTEDERYIEHSGIDVKAVGRAIANMGEAGGASTVTQQLAKLIFTFKEREEKRAARAQGLGQTEEEERISRMSGIERRLYEKVKENVIALRLEQRYTKKEILTMYLNQFDFLQNAVGISSAAKVYFNKTAADLNKEEAAILVGMCKNPGLYNPYGFTVKDYSGRLSARLNISKDKVTEEQMAQEREADSLRAVNRRNTVLYKWYENSSKNNPALTSTITKAEYDSLKALPIVTDYQSVDHKEGLAPYFRESLRGEITDILNEKNEDGEYKYQKPNGERYNIYSDGLKIFTTINVDIQRHAENALKKHLKKNIQEPFTKNNKRTDKFPFAYDIKENTIENLMNSARKRSTRYRSLRRNGVSEKEAIASFDKPIDMKVFSWNGDIDTVMTPNDSIRYYKNIMRAGLVSIEPQTGFIKAWVGGPDINHFAYDHVAQGKRQVGSTIKPFIYSAGMQFGVITPCETTPNISYCVDVQTGSGVQDMTQWCPKNSGSKMKGEPVAFEEGLANSMNNITVAVMAKMGGVAGPRAVAKLMRDLNIEIREQDIVPAMCLGVMDLSLLEMVGAQSAFVNGGIYTEPTSIVRIEDRNGNVVYDHTPNAREAMSEELAYATLSMMRKVVTSGTGASLRGTWRGDWGGVTQPTAGKTGTTQNNSDGWFMGLTPDLVTGVWVGAEDMAVRFRSMQWGQGARLALPIYGYMMQKVYKDPNIHISTEEFEKPYGYENSLYNCNGENKGEDKELLPELSI
ncbi:transglycosylase domain-containing protein [Brumimicrobium aurantiacum]|uniref:Penicillin-binding protein n=1 Tax=Brumimicrobium aurantiacum TaxID=1737063 RepID=A0A3E1EX78_9FLAO|nr:transglycosylase domain-containing protein [Brumimicrobium aurantiacum]RFC54083.1 penicillin-binding protein [Brumimicrobium aurantiacum]